MNPHESRAQVRGRFQSASPSDEEGRSLDASIRRVTALIRRLRSVTEEQLEPLLSEMALIKFSKYLDETLAALLENKLKGDGDGDIFAFVSVVVYICTRYKDFSQMIVHALKQQLLPQLREKDEEMQQATLNRQKIWLRILTELFLVGIEQVSVSGIVAHLQSFIKADGGNPNHSLPIICYWAGAFKEEFLLGDDSQANPDKTIFNLFVKYFNDCCNVLQVAQRKLRKMEKAFDDTLFNRGEVTQEQRSAVERAKAAYQRLHLNLEGLSGSLSCALPAADPLVVEEDAAGAPPSASTVASAAARNGSTGFQLYDSGEEKAFYEQVTDLHLMIPHIAAAVAEPAAADDSLPNEAEILEVVVSDDPIPQPSAAFDDQQAAGSGDFRSFVENLQSVSSKEAIDKLAVDFYYLNSRTNRKRLIALLEAPPKSRIDLLPFYSRLIAILRAFVPEVAEAVQKSLLGQFRFLAHKATVHIDARYRVAVYLGELTKFRLLPTNFSYWCIRFLVWEHFTGYNVDMACWLLEFVGKFLFARPESSSRMEELLELMQRKKSSGPLDSRQVSLIENTIASVRASLHEQGPASVIAPKEHPLAIRFIKEAFFGCRLLRSEKDVDSFAASLLKLPWQSPLVYRQLMRRFTKIWKVRYGVIPFVARALLRLRQERMEFVCRVVDTIVEEIRFSLDQASIRVNQRCLAVAAYLGHLCRYGVVTRDLVMEILWTYLCFGYKKSPAGASFDFTAANELDPLGDSFRVFFVCSLLTHAFGAAEKPFDFLAPFVRTLKQYASQREIFGTQAACCLSECLGYFVGPSKTAIAVQLPASDVSSSSSADEEVLETQIIDDAVDEDFELEFLGMIASSAREHKQAQEMISKKSATLDFAVPFGDDSFGAASNENADTVNVRLLMRRKNHKPQTRCVQVPRSYPIATFVGEQMRRESEERRQVNRLAVSEYQRKKEIPSVY